MGGRCFVARRAATDKPKIYHKLELNAKHEATRGLGWNDKNVSRKGAKAQRFEEE